MGNNLKTSDDEKALSKFLWPGRRTPEQFIELFGFPYTDLPKHYELGKDGRVYCTRYMEKLKLADDTRVTRNYQALGCTNV